MVEVPWAGPGSGFTALFEAMVLALAPCMPVSNIAKLMKVDDMRLWRLFERLIALGLKSQDLSQVSRIALDETASRRGHHYITTVVDVERKRVIFACQGKGSDCLKEFAFHLETHKGNAQNIDCLSCDMSPAFLSGVNAFFPKATITLDKFHLVKMVNDAVDITRRAESKSARFERGARYLFLKNPCNLKADQARQLEEIAQNQSYPKTMKAYGLRLNFQDLFQLKASQAECALAAWAVNAYTSGIPAMKKVAQTFAKESSLILSWFETRISNGIMEGFNSVLQSAKSKARGYANPNHMILMSYLRHGKLEYATTHS